MAVYEVGDPYLQKQSNSVIIFVFFQRTALRVIGFGPGSCHRVLPMGICNRLNLTRGRGEAMKRESWSC
jgi:hypothetical protein